MTDADAADLAAKALRIAEQANAGRHGKDGPCLIFASEVIALVSALTAATARAEDVGLIRGAIADPGRYTARADNYRESLPNWQARAVVAALAADEAGTT